MTSGGEMYYLCTELRTSSPVAYGPGCWRGQSDHINRERCFPDIFRHRDCVIRQMKENKEAKISYLTAHLTTIVSVTLVLLIIGIISFISIGTAGETRRLRQQVEITAVMADSVPDAAAKDVAKRIAASPYAAKVTVVTAAQAAANWKADTGEDLVALFGVNILSPEINVSPKAAFSTPEGIEKIAKDLSGIPGVESVATPDVKMLESMHENIERLTLVLGVIALVMLVISIVLINNTIHLSIYSRRFTIHTMQLVGATNGFIRRPFMLNNMLSGLIAGLIASGVLALVIAVAPGAGFSDLQSWLTWPLFGCVAAGITAVGVVVCGVAAWVAASRFLRKDYGELFK